MPRIVPRAVSGPAAVTAAVTADGIVGDGGWRGDFGQAEVEQLGDQMFVCMPPTAGTRDSGVL